MPEIYTHITCFGTLSRSTRTSASYHQMVAFGNILLKTIEGIIYNIL
jgi:hypothetical protein